VSHEIVGRTFYGNLISQRRGSPTNWYHFDALGSARELTLVSEAVSDTYLYDAWGVPIAATGATHNPFRFLALLNYYCNTDSHTLYVRERTYAPTIATWLSSVVYRGGSTRQWLRLYAYSGNSPLMAVLPNAARSQFDITPSFDTCAPCGESRLFWKLTVPREVVSKPGDRPLPRRQRIVQLICVSLTETRCAKTGCECRPTTSVDGRC
jgi:RHS repeat-associated protein